MEQTSRDSRALSAKEESIVNSLIQKYKVDIIEERITLNIKRQLKFNN